MQGPAAVAKHGEGRVLRFLAGEINRPRALLLAGLSLASAISEGVGLVMLVPLLALVSDSGDAGPDIMNWVRDLGLPIAIGPLLLVFVGVIALRGVLNYYRALVDLKLQRELVDGLRLRAWKALLHCDWRVLSAMRQSDNASLLITTMDRVGMGVDKVISAIITSITLVGVLAAALAIAPFATLAAMVGGVVIMLAYRRLRKRATKLGAELDEVYERLYAELGESLGAMRVIKSFGAERKTAERLRIELESLHRSERTYARDSGMGKLALQVGGAAILALIVWFWLQFQQADLVTVLPMIVLFARGFPLLMTLQGCALDLAYARPAIDSAVSLISRAEAAREPDTLSGSTVPLVTRSIALRGVTVQFEGRDRPALDNVDLELPLNTVTALSGPSGAGKSTLSDVLGGLLYPDAGALLIDGQPLDFDLRRTWRTGVTYVQQMPVLFTGSVRDNLLWADPNADDARLAQVLGNASADFVLSLPDGLDTLVGEFGHQFSGGERQRIILARAMLRAPQLLILDEVANALDRENDLAIARAIQALKTRTTILVIAHGGALEDIADRKVHIECGRIDRASGTP